MKPLWKALYQYALAHRIDRFLEPAQQELADTQAMVDRALTSLRDMNAAAADYADRMEYGYLVLSSIQEEAHFLAGLSIGLELGRLGQGT